MEQVALMLSKPFNSSNFSSNIWCSLRLHLAHRTQAPLGTFRLASLRDMVPPWVDKALLQHPLLPHPCTSNSIFWITAAATPLQMRTSLAPFRNSSSNLSSPLIKWAGNSSNSSKWAIPMRLVVLSPLMGRPHKVIWHQVHLRHSNLAHRTWGWWMMRS